MAWEENHLLRNWSCPPPWPLFILGKWLVLLLRWLLQLIQPPVLSVFDISRGAWQTQVLHTAASLGVADVLGEEGPQTAQQLAQKLGLDTGRLYRLLRCAVQMNLFAVEEAEEKGDPIYFKNNKLSAVLREDHPNCLRHWILHVGSQVKPGWDQLEWAVRTGEKPFEKTHNGQSLFKWLKQDSHEEDIFSKAMKEVDSMGTSAMATDYKWHAHSRIVDIGGAYGSFLSVLLEKNKKPRGLLFDQPQVIRRATKLWESTPAWSKLAGRMEFAGGDFFDADTLPKAKDKDVFVIRLILHDWDDKDSIRILSNIRKAMGTANAKLLIVETILRDEFEDPAFQRGLLDVHMMVTLNGAERTVPQWKRILDRAGFDYKRTIETRGVFYIVEALPKTLSA